MSQVLTINPVLRAVGVIGVVAALVTGVTFAALSSSATLTNNTINSATAELQIYDGSAFASTATGFTINDLVPGTPSAPQAFYLKNAGGVPLDVSANVATLPSVAGIANFTDIEVDIDCYNVGTISTTIGALNSGPVLIGTLPAGATGNSGDPSTVGNCTASFDLNPAGLSGSSATVSDFTFTFSGVQS